MLDKIIDVLGGKTKGEQLMEKAKCIECGAEVDAFVSGEGKNFNDIEVEKNNDGLPILKMIRYFRSRDDFNNFFCDKCATLEETDTCPECGADL